MFQFFQPLQNSVLKVLLDCEYNQQIFKEYNLHFFQLEVKVFFHQANFQVGIESHFFRYYFQYSQNKNYEYTYYLLLFNEFLQQNMNLVSVVPHVHELANRYRIEAYYFPLCSTTQKLWQLFVHQSFSRNLQECLIWVLEQLLPFSHLFELYSRQCNFMVFIDLLIHPKQPECCQMSQYLNVDCKQNGQDFCKFFKCGVQFESQNQQSQTKH